MPIKLDAIYLLSPCAQIFFFELSLNRKWDCIEHEQATNCCQGSRVVTGGFSLGYSLCCLLLSPYLEEGARSGGCRGPCGCGLVQSLQGGAAPDSFLRPSLSL